MSDSGPVLYQINTRVVLGEIGPRATLDDLPDAFLDDVARQGVEVVWMLGVWQTGAAGRTVSRTQPDWQAGFRHDLPDLTEADICGSPFAVTSYTTNTDFGGDAALARLRRRLAQRRMQLWLDFVPNHVALDHPWVSQHHEFFLYGNEHELAQQPRNFIRLSDGTIRAYGRDPYFPGWPDTLQINYRHAGLRRAITEELVKIADRCDGVRCDMAMLVLPEIFRSTWGQRSNPADGSPAVDTPIWPEAIGAVHQKWPNFVFMAEVYWDREWDLQQQGFRYAYDKRLYDRLRAGGAGPVRDHLGAGLDYQRRLARFLENHDEPRAAAVFPWPQHQAAAVVTYLTPGLRFFYEGQWVGRKAHASIHLARRKVEAPDTDVQAFYGRLLRVLTRSEVRGEWRMLNCRGARSGGNPNNCLAWTWHDNKGGRLLVVVNFDRDSGRCALDLPWPVSGSGRVRLVELLQGPQPHQQPGEQPQQGLEVDLPGWGYAVYEINGV